MKTRRRSLLYDQPSKDAQLIYQDDLWLCAFWAQRSGKVLMNRPHAVGAAARMLLRGARGGFADARCLRSARQALWARCGALGDVRCSCRRSTNTDRFLRCGRRGAFSQGPLRQARTRAAMKKARAVACFCGGRAVGVCVAPAARSAQMFVITVDRVKVSMLSSSRSQAAAAPGTSPLAMLLDTAACSLEISGRSAACL